MVTTIGLASSRATTGARAKVERKAVLRPQERFRTDPMAARAARAGGATRRAKAGRVTRGEERACLASVGIGKTTGRRLGGSTRQHRLESSTSPRRRGGSAAQRRRRLRGTQRQSTRSSTRQGVTGPSGLRHRHRGAMGRIGRGSSGRHLRIRSSTRQAVRGSNGHPCLHRGRAEVMAEMGATAGTTGTGRGTAGKAARREGTVGLHPALAAAPRRPGEDRSAASILATIAGAILRRSSSARETSVAARVAAFGAARMILGARIERGRGARRRPL